MTIKLYTYTMCPFCDRVRQAFADMKLDYEEIPAERGTSGSLELVSFGGKQQVPFLRVEREGKEPIQMYESNDIIAYAREHLTTD